MGAFVQELFSVSVYKRSQGRLARQATFAALAIIVALAAWSLHSYYSGVYFGSSNTPESGLLQGSASPPTNGTSTAQNVWIYGIPLALLAVGLWASFRIVQMPNFADFLISVEGEMNKVSWPARGELFRASVVVMFVIFFLAAILFLYDLGLTWLMKVITIVLTQFTDFVGGIFGG